MKISGVFLLSVLVFHFTFLAQASQSRLFRRGKKNPLKAPNFQLTKSSDNDDDLINEAINQNRQLAESQYDLSQYYDISKMNQEKYMKTLNEAYELAKGMFQGTHIEVKEWLEKPEIIKETVKSIQSRIEVSKSFSALVSLAENALFQTFAMITRATDIRSKWYLYQIALKNLISYGKPHKLFYELFINVFLEIDFINYKLRLKSISNSRRYKIVSNKVDLEDDIDKESRKISEQLNSINFDLNSPQLSQNVKRFSEFCKVHRNLEMKRTGRTSYSDLNDERLALRQFHAILRPLVYGNKEFIAQLDKIKRKVPNPREVMTSEEFEAFMAEVYQKNTQTHRFLSDALLVQRPENLETIKIKALEFILDGKSEELHAHMASFITDRIDILKRAIKPFTESLFKPDSVDFKPKEVINAPDKALKNPDCDDLFDSLDLKSVEYKHDHSQFSKKCTLPTLEPKARTKKVSLKRHIYSILEKVMTGSRGLASIKWSDVKNVIAALDGTIKQIGGSINIIYIKSLPYAYPTRFDEPHGVEMGSFKVFTLRGIFTQWGLNIDNYEPDK